MLKKLFLVAISLAPLTALAQAAAEPTYTLISPFGNLLSGSVNLTRYLEGIIVVIISIAGVLAVVMIVVCGIKMMLSGSASGKSEAKECIWNAIFGLLIAIAAWALLFTINPDLLKNNLLLADLPVPVTPPATPTVAPVPTQPGWYFQYKDAQGNTKNLGPLDTPASCASVKDNAKKSTPPVEVLPNGQGLECWQITKPTAVPPPTQGGGTEISTRNALCGNDSCALGTKSNSNVWTKYPYCPYIGYKGGCVNLGGLPGSAIDIAKQVQGACNCMVVITGGTEYWKHKSHGVGKAIIDIRKSDAVNAVIKASGARTPSFGGYFKWNFNGFWFTDEGDHWHACQAGTTGCAA